MNAAALLSILLLGLSTVTMAETRFSAAPEGDHWVYEPATGAEGILLVAHGMYAAEGDTSEIARRFLERWTRYADHHRMLVIAPIFDDERFGLFSQGYGGYRGLFGRHVGADVLVNRLVEHYAERTSSRSTRFYLYGHSAGGQFAARYLVRHPERIIRAVLSAPGRYSYPDPAVAWPYGAGHLNRRISWSDGQSNKESVSPDLDSYAVAASLPVAIVVGTDDVDPQPKRNAHVGNNRLDFAHSWAEAMNRHAKRSGLAGRVSVIEVEGVGHSSALLTPAAAGYLLQP